MSFDTGEFCGSYVRFEGLAAMVMKNPVFQNILLCNMLKVNHCFMETSYLRLQSPKVSQARNQLEANRTLQKECCAYIFKLAY
jgi:hypothetical protein